MATDRIPPKQLLLRPDGKAMTADDIRDLHDQLAGFDDIEWIDDAREIIERFMPDLVDRLPAKQTETFEQAFWPYAGQGEAEGYGEEPAEGQKPAKALIGRHLSGDPIR